MTAMRAFDLIALMNPKVSPEHAKIHLATHSGMDDPLDVYLRGEFNDWQSWQTRKNFERKFVVSLIAMKDANKWLFAGVHRSHGSRKDRWRSPPYDKRSKPYNKYDLREDMKCSALNGRMVVAFQRPSRQSYLLGEKWADSILLSHILPEKYAVPDFPGFKDVHLTRAKLDLIVKENIESWRSALSSVAGVYLISDSKSGKLYVGSAYGEGGIWARWCSYSATGHGGNVELKKLLRGKGPERAAEFSYSVLEIADIRTSKEQILAREAHWKDALLTREHGLNAN